MQTPTPGAGLVELDLNTPRRFYAGGARILAFRGLPAPDGFDGRRPEDWLASTTRLFAEGGDGLTRLRGGALLADALAEDPAWWLGEAHVEQHGADPGILVKLLDAGERLPVHSHPDRGFAAAHLDCAHGKTEAWLVVDAEPGARVWLGFREALTVEELTDLVAAQDERLLAALNEVPVERGDAVLVPAGQPHAIGAGVLVVELQEPTDFSVMLEHERFGLEPEHAWLGLARELALRSVDRGPLSPRRLLSLRTRWDVAPGAGITPALPDEASPYFRAEVLDSRGGSVEAAAGFSVLVVVDGAGTLAAASAASLPVRAGQVVLTPYAAGALTLSGPVVALRASPATAVPPATHPGPSTEGAAPGP